MFVRARAESAKRFQQNVRTRRLQHSSVKEEKPFRKRHFPGRRRKRLQSGLLLPDQNQQSKLRQRGRNNTQHLELEINSVVIYSNDT